MLWSNLTCLSIHQNTQAVQEVSEIQTRHVATGEIHVLSTDRTIALVKEFEL